MPLRTPNFPQHIPASDGVIGCELFSVVPDAPKRHRHYKRLPEQRSELQGIGPPRNCQHVFLYFQSPEPGVIELNAHKQGNAAIGVDEAKQSAQGVKRLGDFDRLADDGEGSRWARKLGITRA